MRANGYTLASLTGWTTAEQAVLTDLWHRLPYLARIRAMNERQRQALARRIGKHPNSVHNWRWRDAPWQGRALVAAELGDPDEWPDEIRHRLLAIREELRTQP